MAVVVAARVLEGCHHVRARRVRILERTRLFHKCCQSILAECQVIFKDSGMKWCLIFLFPTIMFLSWLMAKLKDLSCSLTLNKLEWQALDEKISVDAGIEPETTLIVLLRRSSKNN